MDERQQKNRNKPTLGGRAPSEAWQEPSQGSESDMAENERDDQETEQLMELILEKDNLKAALKAVLRNKGAPGIDGMTVDELPGFLKANWTEIRKKLLEGKYKPQPVRRVEIPKPGGGARMLGVPTVLDRFLQQAVQQILQQQWNDTFSDSSYGFRPGRSAHQAIERARQYIREGWNVVVDILRAFLNAGVMENGVKSTSEEGLPQGGPLSPILSNVLLDELDRELESRGLRFVRFADDCNVYVKTERAGLRVMQSITNFLAKRLRLKVNQEKSAVGKPSRRKFLGFSFTINRDPKIRIATQSLIRAKQKIRHMTRPTKGQSLKQVIEELALFLNGWRAYFGYCETPSVFKELDKWIRRRLRALAWRHWKRGRTRFASLCHRNVDPDLAAQTCGCPKGPWHIAKSPALNIAFPIRYFAAMGLPTLAR